MDRRSFVRSVGGVAAVGAASGTAAAQDGEDDVHEIEMRTEGSEYLFDPIGLHVESGDTVRWINVSGAHSTTAYGGGSGGGGRIPEGAEAWDSGVLSTSGAEFEYTFEVEGTYDYFCIPHKTLGMIGRIVCGEPGGPAEESENPDVSGLSSGVYPSSDVIVEDGAVAYPYQPSGGVPGGEGSGSDLPLSMTPLQTGAVGLLGLAAVAVGTYRFVNSEGERYRVGSSEWRESKE